MYDPDNRDAPVALRQDRQTEISILYNRLHQAGYGITLINDCLTIRRVVNGGLAQISMVILEIELPRDKQEPDDK